MRRLNVGYRLGMMATVFWLAAAPIVFTARKMQSWGNTHTNSVDVCLSRARSGPEEKLASSSDACYDNMSAGWQRFDQAEIYWSAVAVSALVAVIAWAVAMIVLRRLSGRRKRRQGTQTPHS